MFERKHILTCHSEGAKASRGIFPSGRLYLAVVHYRTWWIPPLRWRCGRNDISGRWFCLSTRVVFDMLLGDESSPLHCVVPFNCTGCIRKVPGTAHRPFPTVSLEGGTIQPHGLYTERCLVVLRTANQNLLIAGGNYTLIPPMNHRRYIA